MPPQVMVTRRVWLQRRCRCIIAPDLPACAAERRLPPRLPPGDADLHAGRSARPSPARLKENLTPEMLKNFSLFLYVSKASDGPLAQRLYVFRKNAGRRSEPGL